MSLFKNNNNSKSNKGKKNQIGSVQFSIIKLNGHGTKSKQPKTNKQANNKQPTKTKTKQQQNIK